MRMSNAELQVKVFHNQRLILFVILYIVVIIVCLEPWRTVWEGMGGGPAPDEGDAFTEQKEYWKPYKVINIGNMII